MHFRKEESDVEHFVQTHVFRERMPHSSSRSDIISRSRTDSTYIHKVIFVIPQKNMDRLTEILYSVSDPLSSNYGHHLLREEVNKLTFNGDSRNAVVSYLLSNGASIVSESLNGDYITAEASVELWEKIFNTEFYIFNQKHQDERVEQLVRAERYWIPKEIDEHVEGVLKLIEMPVISSGSFLKLLPSSNSNSNSMNFEALATPTPQITPAILKRYYNMSNTAVGSPSSTQAIFASIEQYMSPADLSFFQTDQNIPINPISGNVGGHVSSSYCISSPQSCAEGNLDIQYIMSVSPLSPTTFWYTDETFSDFLVSVGNTVSPPLVISISYGQEEDFTTVTELNAFQTQSVKLGVMGVTILVASGDDGANSRTVRTGGTSMCGYSPSFPASCPFVTAVGATSVRWSWIY